MPLPRLFISSPRAEFARCKILAKPAVRCVAIFRVCEIARFDRLAEIIMEEAKQLFALEQVVFHREQKFRELHAREARDAHG